MTNLNLVRPEPVPQVDIDFTEWKLLSEAIKDVPNQKTSLYVPEAAVLRMANPDNEPLWQWLATYSMFAKGTTKGGSKVFIVANVPNYMSTSPAKVSEAYKTGQGVINYSFILPNGEIDALAARDGEKDEFGLQRVTVISAETLAKLKTGRMSKTQYDEHNVANASFGSSELSALYGDTHRARFKNCGVWFDNGDNFDTATGRLAAVGSGDGGLCGGSLGSDGRFAVVAPEAQSRTILTSGKTMEQILAEAGKSDEFAPNQIRLMDALMKQGGYSIYKG